MVTGKGIFPFAFESFLRGSPVGMAYLFPLNESFFPEFESVLGGGMLFGPLLNNKGGLRDGTLSVWVSKEVGEILPGQWRTDIFWPHPFHYKQELYAFIDRFFGRDRNGIMVTDTSLSPSMDNNQEYLQGLEWFSCDSPRKKEKQVIAAYVTSQSAEHNRYDDLLGVAWPYPTTILLTSLPPGHQLRNGAYYGINSDIIRHLLERVSHVLVGVFDERSMAVWTPPKG